MSYYHDLAFQLRRRKCTERQVLDVLRAVEEAAAGGDPREACGDAEEYATRYEGPRRASPGQRALAPFGVAGLLCVLLHAIWPERFSIDVPVLRQLTGMIAMLLLLAIGSVVAGVVDHRLPRGFASSTSSGAGCARGL